VVDSVPCAQVDIAPTIGLLLGFGTPYATGSVLRSAIGTLAYAHDVVLSHPVRDSLRITARVENPLAHSLKVVVTLRDQLRALIDSVELADDGLHGDGAAHDGTWGNMYSPGADGTIRASIRTDDPASGTSSGSADVAQYVFTRAAVITLDPGTLDFGPVANTAPTRDTLFIVRNVGYTPDSLTVIVDPVNVIPETAIDVSPTAFYLAAQDSQEVRFSIRPQLLVPQYYYALVTLVPKTGIGQTLAKPFRFQVVIAGGAPGASALPEEFALGQNYPNPFNPSTTIRYSLPRRSEVSLTVFNTLGQIVGVLQNAEQEAGYHEVKFDASGLSSGVYFYRLAAGDFVQTHKLALVK
jgi:hypothetical protein